MDEHIEIDKIEKKALNSQREGDDYLENRSDVSRDVWARKVEYLLALIGFSVGLGVVWRFPYLCMRNGGGAFLIPFFIFMFICGFPLYFMELSLGQFSGKSPLVLWCICPLFQGLGFCMVTISFIITLYYGLVVAWILCYLFYSFYPTLPWASCDNAWNSDSCVVLRSANPTNSSGFKTPNRSEFLNTSYVVSEPISINASSSQDVNTDFYPTAATEFWRYQILGISSGIDVIGTPQWHLVLALFLATFVTFLCVVKGVRSVGKVAYVTSLLPYVLLTVILIRSLTLEGSLTGVLYYIKPDFSRLLTTKVWFEAALQVFYSLGPAYGGVITMASYNKFHNRCLGDAALCTAVDCFSNFYCGFVVFSILGFLAHESGLSVEDVAEGGPGLVFQVYPEALSRMPLPHLWSILFFVMLFAVGLDSQFGQVETIIGGLRDMYPGSFGKRKNLSLLIVFCVVFLLSLIFATPGGVFVFTLVDWYSSAYCIFLTSCFECIVVGWIYGAERFSRDVEVMTGRRVPSAIRISWCIVTPLATFIAFLASLLSLEIPRYSEYIFPSYTQVLGVFIALLAVMPIPVIALKGILRAEGPIRTRLTNTLRPNNQWIPNDTVAQLTYEEYYTKPVRGINMNLHQVDKSPHGKVLEIEECCFFCAEDGSKKDLSVASIDRIQTIIESRIADRGEGRKIDKETLLDICRSRKDNWGRAEETRLAEALSDLHAADGRYHIDCYKKCCCDTVAQCFGIGKNTVIKVLNNNIALQKLGVLSEDMDDITQEAKAFMAECYGIKVSVTLNMTEARGESSGQEGWAEKT
ncbi:sodium- and chloride-dependent betaine transporter-like [Ylistrum balloti]|uniref:sodium- and chloride-dependent betaine transporter-like n=1 Tax=Ylistrum balloti TaxID=509963 RepID=UPI002905E01C|nr:sodium- and chloride-dependent betaine transporter-like [Ylistrum balloti]